MTPVQAILEIFAEASHIPSHVRERRLYRQALRAREQQEKENERERLARHADRFLRRSIQPEPPLPAVCSCIECGKEFMTRYALNSHLGYWRSRGLPCTRAEAAE